MKYLYLLGRAVELVTEKGGHEHKYTWTQKDNYVLACDDSGKKLYIFKKPANRKNLTEYLKRFKFDLVDIFKGNIPKWCYPGRVGDARKSEGKAVHIVYSDYGESKRKNYIHKFTHSNKVKMDRPNRPGLIVISGDKVRISRRGILG